VWLGGLRVVRDPARAPVVTREAWARALDKLFAYTKTGKAGPIGGEAVDLFFPDGCREADEWEIPLLLAFVSYGHRGSNGKRLIDEFIDARGRALEPEEMAALLAQQRAWAGLFEIVTVHVGVGLDLRDLVSGETIHVKEVSATTQVRKWDVLFAWVVELGDHLELTGAVCLVPRQHLDPVLDALRTELKLARRRRRGVADRDLVGEIAWAPISALREAYRNVRMPELQNTHGDTLVLCKAHYRFANDKAIRDRLGSLPGMESTGDGFVWLDHEGHSSLGDGPVTLGSIRISAGRLILDVNSRERLERGKALIESALQGLVTHEADSIQDFESAMREYRDSPNHSDKPKRSESEIPDDVRREIIGQHIQQHYLRWIDEPLPALGGKTPRKAAKTRSGRALVEELLKGAENLTARMEGGEAVDFNALRRELGLVEVAPASCTAEYDAAIAPEPSTWLNSDDHNKSIAVEEYHRALAGHPKMPDRHLHALMHVIVENQLAAGDPPEVVATLERLLAGGLTRHEAIHAIGSVVAEELRLIMKEDRAFDRKTVAQSLSRLRPKQWAGSVTAGRSDVKLDP
jgi:hypothetical protein